MTYRNDLDALAARHAALETELAAKAKERDAAGHLLDEARARARLPILDNIRIASPCRADWNQMTGDDRVRACATCNKQVFNLSNMTRDEAQALITEREGNLCGRYYQRHDGTILLADCTIGAGQRRKRRLIAAGAAALLAGTSLAALTIHRSESELGIEIIEPPSSESVESHTAVGAQNSPPPPAPAVHVTPPEPPEPQHEMLQGLLEFEM